MAWRSSRWRCASRSRPSALPHPAFLAPLQRTSFRVPVVDSVLNMPPATRSSDMAKSSLFRQAVIEKSEPAGAVRRVGDDAKAPGSPSHPLRNTGVRVLLPTLRSLRPMLIMPPTCLRVLRGLLRFSGRRRRRARMASRAGAKAAVRAAVTALRLLQSPRGARARR